MIVLSVLICIITFIAQTLPSTAWNGDRAAIRNRAVSSIWKRQVFAGPIQVHSGTQVILIGQGVPDCVGFSDIFCFHYIPNR